MRFYAESTARRAILPRLHIDTPQFPDAAAIRRTKLLVRRQDSSSGCHRRAPSAVVSGKRLCQPGADKG